MQLEIITPEHQIFKGEVNSVQFPGLDGSFQVLKGHTPIISALAKGEMRVQLAGSLGEKDKNSEFINLIDNSTIEVKINGGVVELLNDNIIVLAE